MHHDSWQHKGLRAKLTESLSHKGITDKRVLEAIGAVPRHLFMESGFVQFAYQDMAFPISSGQTISQPYTVAFQTQLLEIKKRDKVLEIGTGSGYQSAILCHMGAVVYTIERFKDLYVKSQNLLRQLGYNARFFYGDGYKGLPTYGPFDKILITAAPPEIPDLLIGQLRPGGKMVAPVGKSSQVMTLFEKNEDGQIKITEHGEFIFVPMINGTE